MRFHHVNLGVPPGGIDDQANSVGDIATSVPPLAQALLTLGGMFIVAYKIDSELALLSLAVVLFVYYAAGYYARVVERQMGTVQGMDRRIGAGLHQPAADGPGDGLVG